ncbi:MAG: phosphatase PAP2 family protein [Bdellovibrionota bacterium]
MNFAFAYEDPTGGKPFFKWSWQDQIKPMFKEAGEPSHLSLLGGAFLGTVAIQPYDRKVRNYREEHGNLLMGKKDSRNVSLISNGWLEVGAAATLLYFDSPEAVKMSRALIFTSLSTGILKTVVRRERPDHSNKASWPSGHTSSMFALAGSLAGSYGLAGAVPGYSAALLVALSRINENKHWAGDLVGGAFIGTYWALVSQGVKSDEVSFMPVPVDDGGMILVHKTF